MDDQRSRDEKLAAEYNEARLKFNSASAEVVAASRKADQAKALVAKVTKRFPNMVEPEGFWSHSNTELIVKHLEVVAVCYEELADLIGVLVESMRCLSRVVVAINDAGEDEEAQG